MLGGNMDDKNTGFILPGKPSKIYEQLRLLQLELKSPKSEEGRFGKYRNVEGILESIKPLLEKYKLTLIMTNKVKNIGERNYVEATARVIYTDDKGQMDFAEASAQAWEGDITRGLDSAQVTGAASSYARKYALGGLFAIDDTKDPDSHKEAPEPIVAKTEKLTDPATPLQKQQLKNRMVELDMDADVMTQMVVSVLGKQTVDTVGDYKRVGLALEGKDDN